MSSAIPTSSPSAPGTERSGRPGRGCRKYALARPTCSGGPLLRWRPRPRKLRSGLRAARPAPQPPPPPPPPGAMAAAAGDGAVKPLQCAMKLANGAIELDTGNRPRVRRGEARRGAARRGRGWGRGPRRRPGGGAGLGGAAGWAPAGPSRWGRRAADGARGSGPW